MELMIHKLERSHYVNYLREAIREESPWILEIGAGVSLLATRRINLDNYEVRTGLIVHLDPSPEKPSVGRVDPLVLIKEEDDWRIIDSLWALGRLAGGGVASAFSQNPLLLLDENLALEMIERILPKIEELGRRRREASILDLLSYARGTSSVIGEKPSEEIKKILGRITPYLHNENIDVRGRINVLLGRWTVEEFRKEFSLPFEAIRVLEEEAQQEYDGLNQLVRVDEFVSFREEEFSLVGNDAEISVKIVLGWVFYSLARRPTGEAYTREFYNEIGARHIMEKVDMEDAHLWKGLMMKGIKDIIEEWLRKREKSIRDEPNRDSKSTTLDRMVRGIAGESSRVSGSLEGFL